MKHVSVDIYIYIYIYIYNVKPGSVKDCKYFFYQYSEFHVFTRQSSVENCYQCTNYNIMVSNKNDVNPGGHPGPRHTKQSHPTITLNSGHPLNVFVKQPIVNAWKGCGCQRHCQMSEKGPTNIILLCLLVSGHRALFLVQETIW